MQNSTTKQKRHAFWSIILTGLVIITCLASTVASSSSYSSVQNSPVNQNVEHSNAHTSDAQLQSLYSQAFKSDSQTQIATTKDACTLSGQLLSYASPKLDWLAAYIIISVMVYYIAQVSILGDSGFLQNKNVPKHRLHVTYCTFQE